MANKKLQELGECQDKPNGIWLFMPGQQIKTNTRLAYIMGLLAGGGAIAISLLLFILDKVTGG